MKMLPPKRGEQHEVRASSAHILILHQLTRESQLGYRISTSLEVLHARDGDERSLEPSVMRAHTCTLQCGEPLKSTRHGDTT